jgi:hypothetical protein
MQAVQPCRLCSRHDVLELVKVKKLEDARAILGVDAVEHHRPRAIALGDDIVRGSKSERHAKRSSGRHTYWRGCKLSA